MAKLSAHACMADVCIRMMREYIFDIQFDESVLAEVINTYQSNMWFAAKYVVLKRGNPIKNLVKGLLPKIYVMYLKSNKYLIK